MKNGKLQDSRLPVCEKFVRCFKSLSRVLSNMIFCNTTKASEEGFLAVLWYIRATTFIKCHITCPWMFVLNMKDCSSPSHDLQHHQKWLQIDLIQPFIIEHDFFLSRLSQLFFQVFTDMPYIKLVINIFVIFSHTLFDLDMAISCNLENLYFVVLHFTR